MSHVKAEPFRSSNFGTAVVVRDMGCFGKAPFCVRRHIQDARVWQLWIDRRKRAYLKRRDCSRESLPREAGAVLISLLSRASTLSSDRAAISSGT